MDAYIVCNKCGHMEKNNDPKLFEEYRPSPCCPMCKSEDTFIINHERVPKHIWDKFQKAAEKQSRLIAEKFRKEIEDYFEKNKKIKL